MTIKIREFSRKLSEPIETDGKWVSTGFEKEIGLRLGPSSGVPEIIENAVNNHLFRLNDNYPPTEGKIGLIAKEFEEYAILVVANNLSDDKARPLVGYRYFWLEKPENTNIDGVGTLLKWWNSNNQPCLELKPQEETENLQKENYNNGYYDAHIFQREAFEEYYHQVEDIRNKIKETPYIFTIKENENNTQYPDYLQLHSLALYLHLQEEYPRPIAWTWNIFNLENPHKFTLICCADQESFDWNNQRSNSATPLDKPLPESLSSDTVQKTPTIILKQAIQDIAKDKEVDKNLATLVNELENSNSLNWDWEKIIDETWFNNSNQRQKIIYQSMIPLLNPKLKIGKIAINPVSWIESLKSYPDIQNQKQTSPVNEEATDGIDIQAKLLRCIYKHPKIKDQLVGRMYKIIRELLLDLSTSEKNYHVIEWLFVNSAEFWKGYLTNYGDNLFKNLQKYKQQGNEEIKDNFLLKIIEDLKVREEKEQINTPAEELVNQTFNNQSTSNIQYSYDKKHPKKFPNYQPIAKLFEKIKLYFLCAFFYQLTMDFVPSNVYNKSRFAPSIIKLKPMKNEKVITQNTDQNDNPYNRKNKTGLIVFGIIIGILVGIPIQKLVKKYDIFWYSPISANNSDIISPTPIRELYLYLNLLESGDFRKDVQQKNIKNLDNLISAIPNFKDTKFKQAETRNEFLKNRNNNFAKQPLYGYIKGLTPTVKEKPNQTYKADEIDKTNPVKNIEIKQVKEILAPLGIYNEETEKINDTWDAKTSEAIKVFQKEYNIKPFEGNLGPDTWKVLSIMIQDKQLEQAAKHLQLIINGSKNYDQFKTKYDQMNECKKITDQLYSECLKEGLKQPEETEETEEIGATQDQENKTT